MNSRLTTTNERPSASQSHEIKSPAIGNVGKGAVPMEWFCIPSDLITSRAACVNTQSISKPVLCGCILSAPLGDGRVGTSILPPGGAGISITRDRLLELFIYEPLTGEFFYRSGRSGVRNTDKPAGSLNDKGYRILHIDGQDYRAHRLAWLYVHGQMPAAEIDHRNGVRDDNRIDNLRDVSTRRNAENRARAQAYSRTGLLGVRAYRSGRFQAQIQVNGCARHLGTFDTAAEAHEAYLAAKRIHHPGAHAAFLPLTGAEDSAVRVLHESLSVR